MLAFMKHEGPCFVVIHRSLIVSYYYSPGHVSVRRVCVHSVGETSQIV